MYNGAGVGVITAAVEQGTTPSALAFVLKIALTALTLGAGYKGGEIVPTFFVGATFGCVIGPLLGLAPGFAAAVGMAACFCGVANCPLASILLSMELFGGQGMPLFALAVARELFVQRPVQPVYSAAAGRAQNERTGEPKHEADGGGNGR